MLQPSDTERADVGMVLQAIYERYGFDLRSYSQESIRRRVFAAQARTNTAHLGELRDRLLEDPLFFQTVLSTLTVQVTDMFRDPEFFRSFRTEVLPRLRVYPRIKIWHAGCASGEEVYSLAILLMEEGLYERAEIYGTDLDSSAIERAQAAIYPEERWRRFEENYRCAGGMRRLEDYATFGYGNVVVRSALRKNIFFFQHDLGRDFAPGAMHVIFCRNVALYFGETLRERVHGVFQESLRGGGFLCLGMSEALPRRVRPQFEEISSRFRIFQRRTDV